MPIEVKELHIKGVVGNDSPTAGSSNNTAGTDSQEQQEAIIAACVEKVLKILEDKKER
jgi:hypothetical protein